MNPSITALQMAILAENIAPSIIEETTENVDFDGKNVSVKTMYVGYASKQTTNISSSTWLIKRITELKNNEVKTTIIEYANGTKLFNQSWENREDLEYRPLENCESLTPNFTDENL